MYNDQLVYEVVIWAFFRISLRKEKITLIIVFDLDDYVQMLLK